MNRVVVVVSRDDRALLVDLTLFGFRRSCAKEVRFLLLGLMGNTEVLELRGYAEGIWRASLTTTK